MLPRLLSLTLLLLATPALAAGGDGPTAEERSAQWQVPESGREAGAFDDGDARAVAHLLVGERHGDALQVGIGFTLDPGWHVYWRNPGDSGMEPYIEWPEGVAEASPLRWPAPLTFLSGGGILTTYGYSESVVLPTEVRVAAGATEVVADVDYLACDVGGCIPHRSALRRVILDGADAARITAAIQDLPRRLEDDRDDSGRIVDSGPGSAMVYGVEVTGGAERGAPLRIAMEVRVPDDCATAGDELVRFVPDKESPIAIEQVTLQPIETAGRYVLAMDGTATRHHPAERLKGVLACGAHAWEADVPIDVGVLDGRSARVGLAHGDVDSLDGRSAREGADDGDVDSLDGRSAREGMAVWRVLLFALLGGMLLNLMPCVLPVLAIKVASFAESAHQERAHVVRQGAGYTAGVVGTLTLLAAVVVGLQQVGVAVGWGFQFQEPWFVVGVALLLTVFAANLFGAWEVRVGAGRLEEARHAAHGWQRSLFEGVLAVVVATPCSAPFLGAAVGFALASSPLMVLATFVAIGLGLALPFVLLTLVPGAARLVPKPGAWMNTLKHGLGFALLATVVWLVSVAAAAFGATAAVQLLTLCVWFGFGAWVFGRVQLRSGLAQLGALAMLGAITAFVMPRVGSWTPATDPAPEAATADGALAWQPWSAEAVATAQAEGRPVFVDFTADWCISCKVNERRVLAHEDVMAAFEASDTALLLGDWTHRDDVIRAELARYGRAGVPLYLYYAPGAEEPVVLPEILTRDLVLETLATP